MIMGKISPVAAKYIVRAEIDATGVVEKPDIIGAVFGQTEGLLGAELELRELQKSGRIGRIEVRMDTKNGKTRGVVELPSSMDKAETAIVAAALETIDRVGPCEAKVRAIAVEDVRETKRKYIMDRAKNILKEMLMKGPDSQEILGEVTESVRQAELLEYGPDRLPAGPAIDSSEEVIVVEGRADVLTLLRHGIKNVIAIGGNKIPRTIVDMSAKKVLTLFVDGDRGGQLIVKEFLMISDVDFIAFAPDGKEVEELTKKEIHKAIRTREPADQVRSSLGVLQESSPSKILEAKKEAEAGAEAESGPEQASEPEAGLEEAQETEAPAKPMENQGDRFQRGRFQRREPPAPSRMKLSQERKDLFRKLIDDLVGTRGAYLLREAEILGKVPIVELGRYLEILKADTVVMDGKANRRVAIICRNHGINTIVSKETESGIMGMNVFTLEDLGE
jgi:DNA primase